MTTIRTPRRRSLHTLSLALAGAFLAGIAAAAAEEPRDAGRLGIRSQGEAEDPIAKEIDRLSAFVAAAESTSALWLDVKGIAEPTLSRAKSALHDGRRLLALQRLGVARQYVAAMAYVFERPERERHDEAAFEAEWRRMRDVVNASIAAPATDEARTAAVRALTETAIHRVPILHASSLDYGRATTPETGFFYLGQTRAQSEFAAFCRALPRDGRALAEPPIRDIGPDIDALESEVLAAYRPPASIARHPEFITVGGHIKEARELNAAGRRHGALLEYLHAAMRFGPLRPASDPPVKSESLAASLDSAEARFAATGTDQSLGTLFVETARADLESMAAAPGSSPLLATAIVAEVLPRYAAALEPGRAAPTRPEAEVVVTLVRWPFT